MLTAPISLYIDVQEGRQTELEVASRAALEFAAGVREAAYLFDPSFEFRLELLRADEGSNWIKTRLRWVRGFGYAKPTLAGVAMASSLWFLDHVGDKVFDAVWDHYFNPAEISEGISRAVAEDIAERAAKAAASEVAATHFKNVYRELERDKFVTGVGVAPTHTVKPRLIIPREEFAARSANGPDPIVVGEKRTTVGTGDFVIVKPVLKEGSRGWRLNGPAGEFTAKIMDDRFLNAILSGTAPVPLAAEIHISADFETDEERTEEGAWKPTAHRIIRVHDIRRQPMQQPLIGPRDDEDADGR